MVSFHQRDHDHLGSSYVGMSRKYRWWVKVRHEYPYQPQLQVHRVKSDNGVQLIGKPLFSNLSESEKVNNLDTRLRNKIARLSIEHHLKHGRKNEFQEYKREYSAPRRTNGTSPGPAGGEYRKPAHHVPYRNYSR